MPSHSLVEVHAKVDPKPARPPGSRQVAVLVASVTLAAAVGAGSMAVWLRPPSAEEEPDAKGAVDVADDSRFEGAQASALLLPPTTVVVPSSPPRAEVLRLDPVVVTEREARLAARSHTRLKREAEAKRVPRPEDPRDEAKRAVEEKLMTWHGMLPELTEEAVRRVLAAEYGALERCYTRTLRRTGLGRDARLHMVLTIAATGEVTEARVEGGDIPGLASCIRGAAKRWRFPVSRSGAVVPVPLAFSAVES